MIFGCTMKNGERNVYYSTEGDFPDGDDDNGEEIEKAVGFLGLPPLDEPQRFSLESTDR